MSELKKDTFNIKSVCDRMTAVTELQAAFDALEEGFDFLENKTDWYKKQIVQFIAATPIQAVKNSAQPQFSQINSLVEGLKEQREKLLEERPETTAEIIAYTEKVYNLFTAVDEIASGFADSTYDLEKCTPKPKAKAETQSI